MPRVAVSELGTTYLTWVQYMYSTQRPWGLDRYRNGGTLWLVQVGK